MLLKGMIDEIETKAKILLEKDKYLQPLAVLCKAGKVVFVMFQIEEGCQGALSKFFQDQIKSGVTEFIFISEAWTVLTASLKDVMEWKRRNGSLETHPQRKECVIMTYQSETEQFCHLAEMKRKGENLTLGDFEPGDMSVNGMLGGLFIKARHGTN